MKYYIIHYDKLKERKKALKKQLKRERIKAEWFIQKEKEPYTKEEINRYYERNNKKWKEKAKFMEANIIPRPLAISEISLTINHFKILDKIAGRKDEKALIFEDDVILERGFKEKVARFLKLAKEYDWDILFLDWCNTKPPATKRFKIVKSRKDKDSWGTAAFLIKKKVAKKIVKEFNKFSFCIDEEIKYLAKKLGLKIIWVNPPITRQGSVYGNFESTLLEREKMGIKKFVFWKKNLYSFLSKNGLGFFSRFLSKIERSVKSLILR